MQDITTGVTWATYFFTLDFDLVGFGFDPGALSLVVAGSAFLSAFRGSSSSSKTGPSGAAMASFFATFVPFRIAVAPCDGLRSSVSSATVKTAKQNTKTEPKAAPKPQTTRFHGTTWRNARRTAPNPMSGKRQTSSTRGRGLE